MRRLLSRLSSLRDLETPREVVAAARLRQGPGVFVPESFEQPLPEPPAPSQWHEPCDGFLSDAAQPPLSAPASAKRCAAPESVQTAAAWEWAGDKLGPFKHRAWTEANEGQLPTRPDEEDLVVPPTRLGSSVWAEEAPAPGPRLPLRPKPGMDWE